MLQEKKNPELKPGDQLPQKMTCRIEMVDLYCVLRNRALGSVSKHNKNVLSDKPTQDVKKKKKKTMLTFTKCYNQ